MMSADWNLYSKHYENLHELVAYRELIDRLIITIDDYAKEDISNLKILDLGSGTGSVSLAIASNIPDLKHKIKGIEINSGMLAIAETKAKKMNLDDKVDFVKGDLRDLRRQVGNDKYDVITLNNVLYIIEDKLETVRLLRELLSPQGILIISDPVKVEDYSYWNILKQQTNSLVDLIKTFSILTSLYKIYIINKDIDSAYERYDREMYLDLFKKVDLDIVHQEKSYADQANLFVLKK